MTRQAAAYRERRVLLAGDAAPKNPPFGALTAARTFCEEFLGGAS
jgi:2-polyprenyl-6-methoxyphenol hydroxylase-like FAD-dependent oxidoreductase